MMVWKNLLSVCLLSNRCSKTTNDFDIRSPNYLTVNNLLLKRKAKINKIYSVNNKHSVTNIKSHKLRRAFFTISVGIMKGFSVNIVRIVCFISLTGVVYGIKQTGEYYVNKEDSDCVVIDGKRICNGGHKYYTDQKACSVVDQDGVCLNVPRADEDCPGVNLITREGWNASTSKTIEQMKTPVSIVFIHHTAQDYCHTQKECIQKVQHAQNYHINYKGWDDISYNFLVGEDGNVYEARGWDRIGAHTLGFNKISVSIAALGDFNHRAPNQKLLDAIDRIIACGVTMKKITPDYGLYGHRDARPNFDSPGHYLYEIIRGWKHYDKNGPSKNKTTH